VNGDDKVTIADVLEILKYLANMKSAITDFEDLYCDEAFEAACVTGGEFPVIADVLEILKYLAGMNSAVKYIIIGENGYRWPLDSQYTRISQDFGCWNVPPGEVCESCANGTRYRCHNGTDLIGVLGEECGHAQDRFCSNCVQVDRAPLYAMQAGVVREAKKGSNGGFGNVVIIDHDDGYSTLYAHMHDIFVNEEQRVRRGDIIGIVGNTGQSTGPHLHLELRLGNTTFYINGTGVNGIAVDMMSLFPILMKN
jgi:murein DD-endopeptidase MepM/ murein hydrolase activator NlpD